MTRNMRMSWLTLVAAAIFAAIAAGCGSTSPAGGGGGMGGAAAGASGAAGVAGAGGEGGTAGAAGTTGVAGAAGTTGIVGGAAGMAGVAGGAAGGAAGRGGAGGGAAGRGGAGGGAAGRGVAGGGAAGRGGVAGGAAGRGGAAGTAGTASDGGTLICQQEQVCTAGDECRTACGTGATPTSTTCVCAPAGGNRMELACVSLPCNRDAGMTDAGTILPQCPSGIANDDDCTSPADTICSTSCTGGMLMRCVCVPRGGGGGARWMCGARTACP